MSRLVVNQSNYIPWKGYFDLIHDADIFVFYDDVAFSYNSWRNRNCIKTPDGATWLTIPVGAKSARRICEVELPQTNWPLKHWKTLGQYYARAPYFERYSPIFEHCYLKTKWSSLAELNQHLIKVICHEILGIRCTFKDSRDFHLIGKGQERLMSLIDQIKPSVYISGPTGRNYLEEAPFVTRGIELIFKKYEGYPTYPQFFPPFVHEVSIVDLIFQTGPKAPAYIWDHAAKNLLETTKD